MKILLWTCITTIVAVASSFPMTSSNYLDLKATRNTLVFPSTRAYYVPVARDTTTIKELHGPLLLRLQRSVDDTIVSAIDEDQLYEDSEQRFKRSADVKPDVDEDWADGEIVEEKDIPKDAEKIDLSANSEYEELPSTQQSNGRSKRDTVTVIRIRNKRTGKVTYVIIRRRK